VIDTSREKEPLIDRDVARLALVIEAQAVHLGGTGACRPASSRRRRAAGCDTSPTGRRPAGRVPVDGLPDAGAARGGRQRGGGRLRSFACVSPVLSRACRRRAWARPCGASRRAPRASPGSSPAPASRGARPAPGRCARGPRAGPFSRAAHLLHAPSGARSSAGASGPACSCPRRRSGFSALRPGRLLALLASPWSLECPGERGVLLLLLALLLVLFLLLALAGPAAGPCLPACRPASGPGSGAAAGSAGSCPCPRAS
jgi:hypothetical protein